LYSWNWPFFHFDLEHTVSFVDLFHSPARHLSFLHVQPLSAQQPSKSSISCFRHVVCKIIPSYWAIQKAPVSDSLANDIEISKIGVHLSILRVLVRDHVEVVILNSSYRQNWIQIWLKPSWKLIQNSLRLSSRFHALNPDHFFLLMDDKFELSTQTYWLKTKTNFFNAAEALESNKLPLSIKRDQLEPS
jgi:hypothetical protein